LRFICVPLASVFCALSRYKNGLFDYIFHSLPMIVSEDQNKGIGRLKEFMRNPDALGYSIDLKSATDNIPVDISNYVLSHVEHYDDFQNDRLMFWETVKSCYWQTPIGVTRYSTGQPMGLGPSFPYLCITMEFLARIAGANPNNTIINGDDFFTIDKNVAEKFMSILSELSIPISVNKTLMGKGIGEFSGKLIDRFGDLQIFKSKGIDLKLDPLCFVRQYGPAGIKLYAEKDRELISFAASLPEPYGLSLDVLNQHYVDQNTLEGHIGKLKPIILDEGIRPTQAQIEQAWIVEDSEEVLPIKQIGNSLDSYSYTTLEHRLKSSLDVTSEKRKSENAKEQSYPLTFYKRLLSSIKHLFH